MLKDGGKVSECSFNSHEGLRHIDRSSTRVAHRCNSSARALSTTMERRVLRVEDSMWHFFYGVESPKGKNT